MPYSHRDPYEPERRCPPAIAWLWHGDSTGSGGSIGERRLTTSLIVAAAASAVTAVAALAVAMPRRHRALVLGSAAALTLAPFVIGFGTRWVTEPPPPPPPPPDAYSLGGSCVIVSP